MTRVYGFNNRLDAETLLEVAKNRRMRPSSTLGQGSPEPSKEGPRTIIAQITSGDVISDAMGEARPINKDGDFMGNSIDFLNPHGITLQNGLKVLLSRHPFWEVRVASPWEWMECPTEAGPINAGGPVP